MNCEKCQELLSEFLDDLLSFAERSEIEAHLQECAPCLTAHQELVSILNVCDTYSDEYDSPPNPQALWLRISNLIESEQQLARAANTNPLSEGIRESWWDRLGKRTWQVSLPQLLSGIAGIAVAVALFTTIALRGVSDRNGNEAIRPFGPNSTMAATYSGGAEDRFRQQQQVIDYWNQRIEQRKAQWDRRTREAFERNLRVLDEAVAQYQNALTQNPQDEVYQEALDSALENKVAMLRGFSEL